LIPEITDMVKAGRLRLQGGGESVIDYNLPDGEAIIRNHLYSRLWLRDTFGVAPTLACAIDTFGLSAGLPGLFRQLGYRGMSGFDRVFVGNKPYWKGLSGDVMALDSRNWATEMHCWGPFVKNRICPICSGDGCPACGGSGMFLHYSPAASEAEWLYGRVRNRGGDGDFTLFIITEEFLMPRGLPETLADIAAENGMTLRYMGFDEYADLYHADLLAGVDDPPAELIDPRVEGNPVGAGCYTSRIRLKQENRRCESALRTAERLAVAASLKGEPYPAKTLEHYWRRLAFLQFHDALPASHSDEAYAELMEQGRGLRAAVWRIIRRSADRLLADLTAEGEGIPFVAVNPLEFDVTEAKLAGAVNCHSAVTGGVVIAPDGRRLPVLSVSHSILPESDDATVTFCGDLPAFGYGVFRFIPDESDPPTESVMKRGGVLENGHIRLTFSEYSLTEIYSKDLGKTLAVEGSFSPYLSDDGGHPWGRTQEICYAERADLPLYCDNMIPPKAFERSVSFERREGVQIARVRVKYARHEKPLALDWTAELMLTDEATEVKVKITAAFDARDFKLSTRVNLPEPPAEGVLHHEIPLGRVKRGTVRDFNSQLGHSDEWPALRYVSARLNGVTVTLCNSGTAGHALEGNAMAVSLLRTPTQLLCGYGVEGNIDPTPFVFDFTLSATAEADFTNAYRRGMILNTEFPTFRLDRTHPLSPAFTVYPNAPAPAGGMPAEGRFMSLPNDLSLLALKGAEDGNGYIARYLGDAELTVLRFAAPVTPCGILEDAPEDGTDAVEVPAFTIRTVRVGKDVLGRKPNCKQS
jgi:alpha-mannosidase